MKKLIINKETKEILKITGIKKGDYEYDFDKLIDNNGNLWLPEQLEIRFIENFY